MKILIIESDIYAIFSKVYMLTNANYDVKVGTTGEKGLTMAREERFDLIIIDIKLPDIGGFELFEKLRQLHSNRKTPIVFISDQLNKENKLRAEKFGVVSLLKKNIDPKLFARQIQLLMNK